MGKGKKRKGGRGTLFHTFMFSFSSLFLALLFSAFCLLPFAFPAPIESAFHTTLENGLQVILMENHANPLIASSVIVKVGVRNETPDINGVSHLLEHLLFNGTKTRTQRQLYDEVDLYGAYNNASTSRDYTLFQMLVQKEYIIQILNIQADMLFNSILPEENLKKERDIVIEEIVRDQVGTYEHPLLTEAERFFNTKLYQGTSYSMPVLGTPELISKIPREKILAYYHQFYRPDNMILILIGDFEKKIMLESIRREFNVETNRHNLPGYPYLPEKPVFSEKTRFANNLDLKIKGNRVYTKRLKANTDFKATPTYLNIALNAPHISDPDFYAFSLLVSILNSNNHPGFHFKDLETWGIQDLQVNLDFNDQFSFLVISASLTTPSDPEQILQQLLTKLDQLRTWTLTPEILEKALIKLETEEIFQSEQFHYYTFYKAPYLAALPFKEVKSYLKNYESITPESIQRVANEYLTNFPFLATFVEPGQIEEEKQLEIADWKLGTSPQPQISSLKSSEKPVSLKKEIFDNGLTVIIKENPDTQVFAFHLLVKHRKALEPEGKSGIAEFLHRMLTHGTTYRNTEEISADLKSIGAVLKVTDDRSIPYDDYYFSPEYSYLRFETPVKYAFQGFMQLADLIKNPRFDPDHVEKVRAELLSDLREDQMSPRVQARNLFYQALFGNHPLGKPILGEEQEVTHITVEDLEQFYQAYFAPHNLIITVVSSLPAEKVLTWLKFYFAGIPSCSEADCKTQIIDLKSEILNLKPEIRKKVIEQEIGKAQSYIYLGNLFQFKEQDEVAIVVTNALLSDRIAFNLREKQGLAYAIGSSVFLHSFDKLRTQDESFLEGIGWFQVFMGTRPENLPRAQEELTAEIKKFRAEEIAPDKLTRIVNRLSGSSLMRRMTSINQAYFLGLQEFRNKPLNADNQFVELAQKLSPADIQRIAHTCLDPEQSIMVIVK